MKTLISVIALFALSSFAQAESYLLPPNIIQALDKVFKAPQATQPVETTKADLMCVDEAKALVAHTAGVTVDKVKLHSGDIIADGVNAKDAAAYQIEGQSGMYIVVMNTDDCTVFLGPLLSAF